MLLKYNHHNTSLLCSFFIYTINVLFWSVWAVVCNDVNRLLNILERYTKI